MKRLIRGVGQFFADTAIIFWFFLVTIWEVVLGAIENDLPTKSD